MTTHIGLKELRQHASDVIRRAEAGETITITVSGRDAAVLSPIEAHAWRQFGEIEGIFSVPTDPDWGQDLGTFDDAPQDPWAQQ